MNNKETSSKNQEKGDVVNCNVDNENAPYIDANIGKQDGTSNYPFYTPPGEGPKPRITSN